MDKCVIQQKLFLVLDPFSIHDMRNCFQSENGNFVFIPLRRRRNLDDRNNWSNFVELFKVKKKLKTFISIKNGSIYLTMIKIFSIFSVIWEFGFRILDRVENECRIDSMAALRFNVDGDVTMSDITFQELDGDWMRFVVQMFDSVNWISGCVLWNVRINQKVDIKSQWLREGILYLPLGTWKYGF